MGVRGLSAVLFDLRVVSEIKGLRRGLGGVNSTDESANTLCFAGIL